jgi:uncharacterized protein (TIRG00374 family)
MSWRSLRKLLSWRLLGPLAVAAAIWWAGPTKILAVLSGADPVPLVVALMLAVPQAAIRGCRWHVLLRGFRVQIRLTESVAMYAMGMTLGAVSPGKVGDFVKILALRQRGCRLGLAVACNVFDRVLDVAFIVLAGYAGMWYFSQYYASQLRVANLAAVAVLVVLALVVLNRRIVAKMGRRLVPERYRPAVADSWNEMVGHFAGRGLTRTLHLMAWTTASWTVQFLAFWLCSVALRLDVPFLYLAACATIVSLSSFVPITVAGVGTRDAVFVLLLGQRGLTSQQSLALSSLVLAVFLTNAAVSYVVSAALGGRRPVGPAPEEGTLDSRPPGR